MVSRLVIIEILDIRVLIIEANLTITYYVVCASSSGSFMPFKSSTDKAAKTDSRVISMPWAF
jgi:hypothetical protein